MSDTNARLVQDPDNPNSWVPETDLQARERERKAREEAGPVVRLVPDPANPGGPLIPAPEAQARFQTQSQTGAPAQGQAQGQGGSTMPTKPPPAATAAPGSERMEHLRGEADAARSALKTLASDEATQEALGDELNRIEGLVDSQIKTLDRGLQEEQRLRDKAVQDHANYETKRVALLKVQQQEALKVQRAVDEINNEILNYEVDPTRAYKSTWQVVGAAIAAAAGAYAQGLSGGRVPNTALAIINKAVDRDILAQKMELGKLQTAANMKNNIYGRMLQRHGDELRALSEARAAAMTVVNMRLGQLRSTTSSKAQAEGIRLTAANVDLQQARHLRTAKMNAANHRLTSAVNEMRVMSSGGPGGGKKTIAQRLNTIIPKIKDAITIFDKVTKRGALLHKTGAASILPNIEMTDKAAQEAADAANYKAAVTMAIKEVVSIFEGSKPSDLDWKVMIQLLPAAWESKAYGKRALQGFLERIEVAAASGEPWKEGALHQWAKDDKQAWIIHGGKNINKRDIEQFKRDLGFTEGE